MIIESSGPVTVSVVTPSFNQGEFIEKTIVSVLSQAGDFYLDYHIMDGGSTDDTLAIVKTYERLLQEGEWRIACRGITYRWTSRRDDGQGDAVNKGFTLAQGEILGWLNSDDIYLPGAVAKAVSYFDAHPRSVMVYGNAYYTDKDGSVTGSYPSEPFSLQRLAANCFICQPSVFLRAGTFREVGPLDATLLASMDYDLWIRIGKRYEGDIGFMDDFLATSRMYRENKTSSLRERIYRENMAITRKHLGYVEGSWIVDYIYEVLQNTDQGRLRVVRSLLARLPALRHLAHPKTLRSVLRLLQKLPHK